MAASLDTLAPDALTETIRGRRSVRRYTGESLPRETLERLIEAASHAPSAHNRQPWRFVILDSAPERERLASAMGARLRADRRADGDDANAIEADAARSHARIVSAPAAILACFTLEHMDRYPDARRAEAERMMAVQGIAMAVQNLLLLAHAEGLGACWMCAPLFCPDTVRSALALPEGWEPQALVTLGHAAITPRRRERRPVREIVR